MENQYPVDKWIIEPVSRFINNSTASGIVLFVAAIFALIISNTPFSEAYHHIWEHKFTIGYDDFIISKSLHHWINDGLMSMFFFIVGLELKREIVAGDLSDPKKAMMPIVAGVGGMVLPALIYIILNEGDSLSGWGIPMATDIAFALGVLYLLGDRVPTSLKVFLTALAIIDDLGAVLVIAFFYTSEISFANLGLGVVFLLILISGNLTGVRNALFYGVIGIGGVWLAFLLSGIHSTIAAVLVAFTIPASVKITEGKYVEKMKELINKFAKAPSNDVTIITPKQQSIIEDAIETSENALTPLQKLEHALHPFVGFVVMPIFALANAGVDFRGELNSVFNSTITLGAGLGLLLGKVLGITGFIYFFLKMKVIEMPKDLSFKHIIGVSFLAAIGFTMSLFIANLAFKDNDSIMEAKFGVISASFIAGLIGYFILRNQGKKVS